MKYHHKYIYSGLYPIKIMKLPCGSHVVSLIHHLGSERGFELICKGSTRLYHSKSGDTSNVPQIAPWSFIYPWPRLNKQKNKSEIRFVHSNRSWRTNQHEKSYVCCVWL